MAWYQIEHKLLPEPMVSLFSDAYDMHHLALNELMYYDLVMPYGIEKCGFHWIK